MRRRMRRAQRFKGFVLGDARQEEREEEAGVDNESVIIVVVLAEARR